MKKILALSLAVLGFSSLVSQVVVVRELAMSFYANEFFIGWVLFCWLLSTAVGTIWASRISGGSEKFFRWLAVCHVLSAFLFPLTLALIRSGKPLLGTPAGALPELFPSLLYSLAALTPLCALFGAQFAVAVRSGAFGATGEAAAREAGRAYLWECLGFIAGGIVFSFWLVFMNEFRVAAILAVLNLIAAFFMLFFSGGQKIFRWIALMTAVAFPVWVLMNSVSLQQRTSQLRFPNEALVWTQNTIHGNVSVTRLGSQYHFYQSGLLVGADREDLASEYLVHFPMLAHPRPLKVLLLGTAFNGPLQQVLKHGPEEVRVVEIDPELLKIAAGFLPEDLRAVLRDRRVQLTARDPRDFLKNDDERFDVIIANFPDPASVLVNRNYTEEFFRLVRAHLLPGGVFATHMTFEANALTPEQERLGTSVYATLGQVFPSVRALPEDTLFFLASAQKGWSLDAREMTARLSERGIRPDFVTGEQIRYRLTNDRVERVETAFRNSLWKTKNTDLRPRACYFEFLRWIGQFNPPAGQAFFFLTSIPFPVIFILGLILTVLAAASFRRAPGGTRKLALASMGTFGFSVMAFEITLSYLFQAVFGDLYYRLAWVIAAFMAGSVAGTRTALTLKVRNWFSLPALHGMNAAFFFFLAWGCAKLLGGDVSFGGGFQAFFLGVAFLAGSMAGAAFPLANRLCFGSGERDRGGSVYAADLRGSALGALLAAAFLVPIWGVSNTLILLGAVNGLLALGVLFISGEKAEKGILR